MVNTKLIDKLEDPRLQDGSYSYLLPLACTVAYYGDGKLAEQELTLLLSVADAVVVKDIRDREIVKKEVLLDVLDALKDELEGVEGEREKFVHANEIVKSFSKKTKLLMAGESSLGDDRKKRKKQKEKMLKIFKQIAKSDGQYCKDEKKLVKTIMRGMGLRGIFFKTRVFLVICFSVWVAGVIARIFDGVPGNIWGNQ